MKEPPSDPMGDWWVSRHTRSMSNERFESVWDAIEDTPEAAQNMKLLSLLLIGHKHPRTRLEIG